MYKYNYENKLFYNCNITIPLFNQMYLKNLSSNIETTDNFLNFHSEENAIKMLEQNQKTLLSYNNYIEEVMMFLNNFDSYNKCMNIENSSVKFDTDNLVTSVSNRAFDSKYVLSNFVKINNNLKDLNQRLNDKNNLIFNNNNRNYSFWKNNIGYNDKKLSTDLSSEIFSLLLNDHTQEKKLIINDSIESENFIIYSDCYSRSLDVNGIDKNYFPHIYPNDYKILTYTNLFINYLDDPFTTCTCYDSFETSLKWSVLYELYNDNEVFINDEYNIFKELKNEESFNNYIISLKNEISIYFKNGGNEKEKLFKTYLKYNNILYKDKEIMKKFYNNNHVEYKNSIEQYSNGELIYLSKETIVHILF